MPRIRKAPTVRATLTAIRSLGLTASHRAEHREFWIDYPRQDPRYVPHTASWTDSRVDAVMLALHMASRPTLLILKQGVRYYQLAGTKHNDIQEHDSGLSWVVVQHRRGYVPDEADILRIWRKVGGDPHGYRCGHLHDCCGCMLRYRAYRVATWGNRSIIGQSFGRNI